MSSSEQGTTPLDVPRRYRDNFARHILGVSLHLQSEIMNALTVKHGHSKLRMNFEPYIAIAAERGIRLSDIAAILGISRQAANQTANQIEAAGYLQRVPDPVDGRAKLLVTTPRADALIRQGSAEALNMQSLYAAMVGQRQLARMTTSLIELSRSLELLFPYERERSLVLAAVLPRVSEYITGRLQTLTMAKGHPHLKRSFGTVLTAIGPHGGRIQQMAATRDVSKQAISAIASELEQLGYIRRDPDPEDARQVVLQFTGTGRQLIAHSVASVDELASEFSGITGEPALEQAMATIARIYRSLHLEEEVFGRAGNDDIHNIAGQLTRQLGREGAQALARLLLSGESGD